MSFQNSKIIAANVDADEYHSAAKEFERGDPRYPISPSVLKLFKPNPNRWLDGYSGKSTDATEWGNLVDCLLFTPQLFPKKYAIRPDTYPAPKDHQKVKSKLINEGDPLPWNGNATFCREWADSIREMGRIPVSVDGSIQASIAAEKIRSDPYFAALMEGAKFQVLVEGEYHWNGIIVPVRCLIDVVPDADGLEGHVLADGKTSMNASAEAFQNQIHRYGYDAQAAFDIDLFNAATGERRNQWAFIVQENYAPFAIASHYIDEEDFGPTPFIKNGRNTYTAAIQRYANCLKTGKWPGYTDGWNRLEPLPWQQSEMPAIEEVEQEEAAEETGEVLP